MSTDKWWCYCGLAFWTYAALSEHQREDYESTEPQDHTDGGE